VLANQFGNDGAALAVHVLAGVPGRLELRARVAGLATVMVPIVLVTTVAVAVATGAVGQVPAALGVALAGFGCSAAVASLFSVYAAYALPETANPFAMGGGSAGAKGLLAFVGMVASMVLLAPVLLLALVTRHGALVAAVGLTWAAAAILAGTFLAGHRLDARRPELLMAVTPRR